MAQSKPTALITGATSGIGKAFAELLASEGHDLVLVARNEDELNRIAGVEMTRHQNNITVISLDLAARDAVSRLCEELKSRSISPQILINNAGIGFVGEARALPVADQLKIIDLNVRALTELTLRLLPELRGSKNAGVLNVSSVAAFMPGPYMAIYYASKAFVQSFSDALRDELKGTDIKITTLCPGPVDTGFQQAANMDTTKLFYRLMGPKTAKEVAQAGWIGFRAGSKTVIPGALNLLTVWSTRFMPKFVAMMMVRWFQKPS